MVTIESITEFNPPTPVVSPTLIGVSDKKDYVVKLKSDTGDTSENIIGLRLYLGCHKDGDNNATTSNCRLSVIKKSNQRYSAIDPINPASNDRTDVLRYIIPDEDVEKIISGKYIEITVQLETSQDSAIGRTPTDDGIYVLRARIEYTRCDSIASEQYINFDVTEQ